MNGRRIARYARPQSLSAKRLSAPVILRRRFSTRSTILQASATASAIAATYAGLFCGTVANFRAARIAATIAITACLRFGSTTGQYHFRFSLALHRHRAGDSVRSSAWPFLWEGFFGTATGQSPKNLGTNLLPRPSAATLFSIQSDRAVGDFGNLEYWEEPFRFATTNREFDLRNTALSDQARC
jgi:hypothetical protein